MNQPTTPAVTATAVPASRALTMNGNAVSCWKSETGSSDRLGPESALRMLMTFVTIAVVSRCLGQSGDHQAPIRGPQHLDGDAVEPAEGRRGDHLSWRADGGLTGAEIDHPIQIGQQWADVVRDEQHRHTLLAADPRQQGSD